MSENPLLKLAQNYKAVVQNAAPTLPPAPEVAPAPPITEPEKIPEYKSTISVKLSKGVMWVDRIIEGIHRVKDKIKMGCNRISHLREIEDVKYKLLAVVSGIVFLISMTLFFEAILSWPINRAVSWHFKNERLKSTESYIKEQQRLTDEKIAQEAIYFNKENLIDDILGKLKTHDKSERFLFLSFYVEPIPTKALKEEIKPMLPKIKEKIINVINATEVESITTDEGKRHFKEKLISSIDSLLTTGHIKSLYFDQFLIR